MSCAPTTTDQLRPKLLAMAQEPDPYPFLTVVEDYLAAAPGDDQLRASATGALVGKGLLSVAVELARGCPAASPNAAELHTAADQLARAASDELDWSVTDARFAANLAALRSRGRADGTSADEVERAWQQIASTLTLHQANDGNLQVRSVRSDGRRGWLPAALDYADKVEAAPDPQTWKGKGLQLVPFLLDGVGIGALVPRLHSVTQDSYLNYSPAIFVVDTNVRALALALRLYDWTGPLTDERVYVFVGESAWDDWRRLMRRDDSLWVPERIIRLTRWPGQPPSPADQTLAEVARQRKSLEAERRRHAEEIYAGRDVAFWAKRYETAGPDDPLRVLCVTSRYTTFLQHSARDTLAALERMGVRTRLLIEEGDHALISAYAYLETTADFQPDLILIIDHHRQEYPERLIGNVPFVCWIQDELPALFDGEVGRRLGPLDFAIGFGLTKCVLQHGYPAERFMPCKLAINPAKFARPADAGEPDPALRCDLVYVGHHSERPEALHAQVRKLAGDARICRLMDAFFEETRPLMTSARFNGAWDLDGLLRETEEKVGISCGDGVGRGRLMSLYVRPLANRTIRHTTLTWAADWADATGRTLHIYGNGWEEHPRFARYAKGPAQHGQHLGEIIRQAGINLHTGLNAALHQRVLEALCAGGFVMVRYHPHDFLPESQSSDKLIRYVQEQGIDRPMQIPLEEVPPEWVETMRQRSAITGREMPEVFDVTDEWLLTVRARRHHGDRYDYANVALPDFEQITFNSPESFARRAEHFIESPDQRQVLAHQMQEAVNELFTYDALMPRVVTFITQALHAAGGNSRGRA